MFLFSASRFQQLTKYGALLFSSFLFIKSVFTFLVIRYNLSLFLALCLIVGRFSTKVVHERTVRTRVSKCGRGELLGAIYYESDFFPFVQIIEDSKIWYKNFK